MGSATKITFGMFDKLFLFPNYALEREHESYHLAGSVNLVVLEQVEDDDKQHLMGIDLISVVFEYVVDNLLGFLHLENHVYNHVLDRYPQLYHFAAESIVVMLT